MRKITSLLAALAVAAAALAPAAAEARDHHRGGYRHYDRHYYNGGHYRDHDDALAAGVVGLVLGLAVGSLASQPRGPDCYDSSRRCPSQQGYYDPRYGDPRYGDRRDPRYRDQGYYEEELEGGYDPRYDDPRYDDPRYERDYGAAPDGYYEERAPQCMRRERQWDRYARHYVTVDVPC